MQSSNHPGQNNFSTNKKKKEIYSNLVFLPTKCGTLNLKIW